VEIPVVFLHAGSGNSRMWQHQVAAFNAAGYRFVAHERRDEEGTVADELETFVARLGLDRFHLVGTAAGGIVAVDYALSYSQRLRSLVIANSIVGVQDEEYLALSRRLRPSPQFNALPADVRELGPSYRASNPEGTKRWNALAHAGPPVPLQSRRNHITFASLETIAVPTLLITGDADLYTPPPVLRLFSARFPNCESAIVPECGHSAFWEQPERFNRTVLEFINRH
jgi:pimeloyl-ACP methyl ester carboxylesterase